MDIPVDLIISQFLGILPVIFFMMGPLLLITSFHEEAWGGVVILQPAAKIGLILCVIDALILVGIGVKTCLL